jgi:hypothetical protein
VPAEANHFREAMKRVAALPLLLAIGCTGSVSGGNGAQGPRGSRGGASGPGNPGSPAVPGSSGTPGGPGNPGVPAGSACAADSIPRARTWRLTSTQFRNTVQAVFGFVGPTTDALPQDGQPDGFANQADRLSVPPLLASRFMVATDEIAANVLGRSAEFIKCPLDALGTGTCLRDFLTSTGARAWRRPLTPAEVTKYTALYTKIAAANGPGVAFKSVVQTLLLSPNFLFRTELGDGPTAGGNFTLTHHELASALSYMLTDAPPDAPLMELADQGKLRDPATLAAQARRLLDGGAQAKQIVGSFFRQWLQFDGLPALTKDAALFPSYTPEVVNDLLAESQALIDAVLFDRGGEQSVKGLLTANYAFLNSRTAPLYGVQASGTALVKTSLPPAQRRGLLTQAAFIGAASDSDDTNLPARGRIVREQALCAIVSPPPADFQLEDAKITPDMTNREKFIVHTTNPACASCHAMFDGIGYAMEQYDAIGRYRTMDKAKTIDATGTLPLPSGTLTFTSYVDLIDQVAKLPETYACVASRFDAFATGRAPGDIPACESDPIAEAFTRSGYRLDALVAAIVSSPNFSLRRN